MSAPKMYMVAQICVRCTIMLDHMRDKSHKETSPSKKSANNPDKISEYDSDVKSPSKYIGPVKVLFNMPHHRFTEQLTW